MMPHKGLLVKKKVRRHLNKTPESVEVKSRKKLKKSPKSRKSAKKRKKRRHLNNNQKPESAKLITIKEKLKKSPKSRKSVK